MPVGLPCSLTQTADGRDLYVLENPSYPIGTIAYFNTVTAPSGGAPGGLVPFNIIYPAYTGGVVPVGGIGQGIPIPAGVYLARLSVPAVGESPNGFTKGCFTLTWDGTNLTAGACSSPNNFNSASCYIQTSVQAGSAVPNQLVWGWTGLVNTPATATIEVVLLQQLPSITPLV